MSERRSTSSLAIDATREEIQIMQPFAEFTIGTHVKGRGALVVGPVSGANLFVKTPICDLELQIIHAG
jgi:hypothetical protein